MDRSSPNQVVNEIATSIARSTNSSSVTNSIATVRPNGTVVFTPPTQVKHAIAVPGGGSVSIVQLSIPNNQPVHVQSVIQQPNQQSVIQAPGGAGGNITSSSIQSLGKNVILLNKVTGQGSVIHSTEGETGIHPVQVELITAAKADSDSETVTISNPEEESKKRREILARRPSYRKILSELSSTDTQGTVATLGSNSSNSDTKEEDQTATVIDDGEGGSTITVGGTQYHTPAGLLKVVPASAIQLATQDGSGLQSLQTLTMSNAGGGGTPTIVQYAQGQDGQFFVPVTVSAAELQAYGIRTTGNNNANIGQSVVMTQSGNLQSQAQMAEDASRKRELRLLKNREAAKECRRKKKEYIKCLENRVAVLENQNKALIEELKALKELYCGKNVD